MLREAEPGFVPTGPRIMVKTGKRSFAGRAGFILLVMICLTWPRPAVAVGKCDQAAERHPPVIVICVDTLRADHLSAYGCRKPLTPRMDALLARGVVMLTARTPVALTAPGVASTLTSLQPHHHGSTRNGVPVFDGLATLPGLLAGEGYQTAAVVSNWTLRDHLSNLGSSFQDYIEAFNRKRWGGLFKSEGSAPLVNETVFSWLDNQREAGRPFFLWVHYIEPHAPYRFHGAFAEQAGVAKDSPASDVERYATEVAFVDAQLGQLLDGLDQRKLLHGSLVVLMSDHGESLGEHSYWGHGRNCYENGLRVPLGFVLPGVIPAAHEVPAQVTLLDVAPTVLGLLGVEPASAMAGRDLSEVCTGDRELGEVPCYYQAQRGAVLRRRNVEKGRVRAPLEISRIHGREKITVRYQSAGKVFRYDLKADPGESQNLAGPGESIPGSIAGWEREVFNALARQERREPELAEEDLEKLRALGYVVD